MAHWLLKSEPSAYSWDKLAADGRTNWDGVRNAQALSNLRAMKPGERAFFYHSNEGKDIVGIAEIARSFYPDPNDKSGKLGMVDVTPVMAVAKPVTLAEMRANPELAGMALLRQSRLSVTPLTKGQFERLLALAETKVVF